MAIAKHEPLAIAISAARNKIHCEICALNGKFPKAMPNLEPLRLSKGAENQNKTISLLKSLRFLLRSSLPEFYSFISMAARIEWGGLYKS